MDNCPKSSGAVTPPRLQGRPQELPGRHAALTSWEPGRQGGGGRGCLCLCSHFQCYSEGRAFRGGPDRSWELQAGRG